MKGFCLDEMGKVSLNNWDEEENKAGRGSKTLTSRAQNTTNPQCKARLRRASQTLRMINVKAITANCFGTS